MKVSRILAILSIFILTKEVYSQPKYNFLVGLGYYNPKIETSSPIPNLGFVGKNLLLNWGVRYEIYPNVRIGYTQSHSLHLGSIGSSNYLRNLSYRSISFETFYYIKEKMELNFTLAPMINKGSITITAKAPTDDWDSLLTSYGNSSVRLKTGSSMTKRWLGFSSHVGYRYYFSRLLSVEGKLGYYMSSYSEKNWKLEGEKVTGPPMKLGRLPVFQVNLVIGI
ncbi:MAG: hypothetical protein CMG56_05365 [Candidatus Marinimicrobia bacterium]|nr:hypothetical protein [Candidatus Neomarinimicrobiota bacterium]|tara:strand:+ start:242 stop:910 length:669 start_codon:yes stop_codon:yes gene_type:complete